VRIYISADIEGVAGVVSHDQLGPAGDGYEAARKLMMDEVLAAIEGARSAGAAEIVVSDSHGNGRNLDPARLPSNVQLISGWPRPLLMMQGIELGEYAGFFLIGHHAGVGALDGVLAHTISGRLYQDIVVDGRSWSEADLNCAIGAHFGVPLLLASGDNVFTSQVRQQWPSAQCVTTKWSLGATSARASAPKDVYEAIREMAQRAVQAPRPAPVKRTEGALRVELVLRKRQVAEMLSYLPGFERSGPHTITFIAADVLQLNKIIYFVSAYDPKGAMY
jgi:D-amino peptidase